jgi:Tfp pilus assembly protein PilX
MHVRLPRILRRLSRDEDGFTMIIALLALIVGGLLAAAALVAATQDVTLTSTSINQQKAYSAALAGINRYKYQLSAEPNYWATCPEPEGTVTGAAAETYKVKTLPSTSWVAKGNTKCKSGTQLSIIETADSASGTFRIESTGKISGSKCGAQECERSIVATFTHPGYLNYVYLSNFEEADPETTGKSEAECELYHEEREEKGLGNTCISFPWIPADKIEGPFHTNDKADINGSPVFGRPGHNDAIEMNRGCEPTPSCTSKLKEDGDYTESGATLLPPEVSATELLTEAEDKFAGRTIITLEGNKMKVQSEGTIKSNVPFPSNGVIAVVNSSAGCAYKYKALETMYDTEATEATGCGDVYIKGTYSASLTVIAQNDVVIIGNLTTEGGESGGAPTGNATLGLIAIEHARLYHPIKECEATVEHIETAEAETEVTGGSTILKHVSSTSGISVGSEISGTKIKSGSTVTSTTNLATKGEITISKAIEETETEVEVTEGSTILKKVSPTSGISVGSEISGTKITSGSTVTSTTNLATKGEVTISKAIEGSKGKASKEKIAIKGQTSKEKVEFKTKIKVKEIVECKNTESQGGAVTCNSGGNATAAEGPAKEFGESLKNPIIDAAILSTKHSWGVDNYSCGGELGNITIWGSIAENWRGRVTCCASGGNYVKSYKYDERLANDQPPSFLAPSTTSDWKIERETSPPET